MAMKPPPGFKHPAPATPTRDFGVSNRADVLIALVHEHDWRAGAELGVAEGRTAERILRKCPRLSMVLVDAWAPQPNGGVETYADWPHAQHEATTRARLHIFGDRAIIIKAMTYDAAQAVSDASLDFVFLDADHSEVGVRADVKIWRPKIKPGGMMIGHDYSWPGVTRVVDEIFPDRWIGADNVWGAHV